MVKYTLMPTMSVLATSGYASFLIKRKEIKMGLQH